MLDDLDSEATGLFREPLIFRGKPGGGVGRASMEQMRISESDTCPIKPMGGNKGMELLDLYNLDLFEAVEQINYPEAMLY